MTIRRASPDPSKFNSGIVLPYELRLKDFELAMQDIYDFFFDVNSLLWKKGLPRFDDMLRPAAIVWNHIGHAHRVPGTTLANRWLRTGTTTDIQT